MKRKSSLRPCFYDRQSVCPLREIWNAMPAICRSYEVMGNVTISAQSTGLAIGTPVVVGLQDMNACAFGSGAIDCWDCVGLIDTWAINEIMVDKSSMDVGCPENYVALGMFLSATGAGFSTLNRDWFVSTFCGAQKVEAEKRGIFVYMICNQLVADLPEDITQLGDHPFLRGGGFGRVGAKAGYYGVTDSHILGHFIRVIFKWVAFQHAESVCHFRSLDPVPQSEFLDGDGVNGDIWSQIFRMCLNCQSHLRVVQKSARMLWHYVWELVQAVIPIAKIQYRQQSGLQEIIPQMLRNPGICLPERIYTTT